MASFNPRTRVGCDNARTSQFGYRQRFNPRTRVGCDINPSAPVRNMRVSIHAPVWGATLLSCGIGKRVSFNPRTRVGCDNRLATKFALHVRFNPRTRVGCDGSGRWLSTALLVSIHAPVWGATSSMMCLI